MAGQKRQREEESGGYGRKVRPKGSRYFCTGEACDSRLHYVADLGLERVARALDEERFALLLDHRQAGKSTLALGAASSKSNTFVIYLRAVKEGGCIWELIHASLAREDQELFPQPEHPAASTFVDMMTGLDCGVNLIFDEANALSRVPAQIQEFLSALRQLRQSKAKSIEGKGLRGLIMIGTDGLQSVLLCNDQNLSPFNSSENMSPQKLKGERLARLLSQWIEDCDGLTLSSSAEEFQSSIDAMADGHVGIAGTACRKLQLHAEKAKAEGQGYSAAQFQKYLSFNFPEALSQSEVYRKLLINAKDQLTSSQQDILSQVVFTGATLFQGSCKDQAKLIDSGYCKMETFYTDNLNTQWLTISAPVLATALIWQYRKAIPADVEAISQADAQDTWKVGRWLLKNVIKFCDFGTIRRSEGLLKRTVNQTYQSAEIQFQNQFSMIGLGLYRHLENLNTFEAEAPGQRQHYKLIWEARKEGERRRLDLLAVSGRLIRIGHELLVGQSQTDLDGHIQKSNGYAESLDCKCWVVQFCVLEAAWPESNLSLPATNEESKVEVASVSVNLKEQAAEIRYSRSGADVEKVSLAKPLSTEQLSTLWK